MKKLLVFTMMLSIVSISFAQKQQTDSKTLEVNFTPFGESPISINGIQFRKFSDDYSAIRMGVWISSASNKTVSMQAGTMGEGENLNPETMFKTSAFNLTLSPGIEKHFDGTSRLSPYVGGELNISYGSSSQVSEYWSGNLLMPSSPFASHSVWDQTVKNGSFGLGLSGLAGMDFYFADNIYFGAEFGFGFMFNSQSDTKFSSSDDNAWAVAALNGMDVNFGGGEITVTDGEVSEVVTRNDETNGSSTYIGPSAKGAIRLGFIF